MGTNKRRFLVVSSPYRGFTMQEMIPIENISTISGFDNGVTRVGYVVNGEEIFRNVKEPFCDIVSGKCTVEL